MLYRYERNTKRKNIVLQPDYSNMSRRVAGFGYVDMRRGCSKTPQYKRWVGMLQRCYTTPVSQLTYSDCYVCDEWAYLSNFSSWMVEQNWKGKQLDKDLLGDTYKYSPENCCFISGELNNLIEPRGVLVDMSDAKREKVLRCLEQETDTRVMVALTERYNL